MGIAVVIPTISFSNNNLGKVVAAGGPLESLAIGGPDNINSPSNSAKFFAIYTPYDTNERDVTWSIQSGDSYASIDSNTGEVSVLPVASNSEVTIKVTSNIDSSITATKTIYVSYSYVLEYVASKAGEGIPYITTINPSGSYNYEMVFMLEDALDLDVFGTRISAGSQVLRFFAEPSVTKFRVLKLISSGGSYDLNHTIQTGKKYRVVMTTNSQNGIQLYEVNGSSETLLAEGGDMSAQVSSSIPIMLAAFNNNGTPVAYKNAKLRIYNFRIFTNSGDVLRLKPHLNPQTSLPGLKDDITDTLYPYHATGTATLYYNSVGGTEQSVSINS